MSVIEVGARARGRARVESWRSVVVAVLVGLSAVGLVGCGHPPDGPWSHQGAGGKPAAGSPTGSTPGSTAAAVTSVRLPDLASTKLRPSSCTDLGAALAAYLPVGVKPMIDNPWFFCRWETTGGPDRAYLGVGAGSAALGGGARPVVEQHGVDTQLVSGAVVATLGPDPATGAGQETDISWQQRGWSVEFEAGSVLTDAQASYALDVVLTYLAHGDLGALHSPDAPTTASGSASGSGSGSPVDGCGAPGWTLPVCPVENASFLEHTLEVPVASTRVEVGDGSTTYAFQGEVPAELRGGALTNSLTVVVTRLAPGWSPSSAVRNLIDVTAACQANRAMRWRRSVTPVQVGAYAGQACVLRPDAGSSLPSYDTAVAWSRDGFAVLVDVNQMGFDGDRARVLDDAQVASPQRLAEAVSSWAFHSDVR